MRVSAPSCYVLRTRAYSENSKILDIFSKEHGRMTALAKGVCRLKSPLRPALQLFVCFDLSWAGKGGLKVLTQVDEIRSSEERLKGLRLISALYLNELLLATLSDSDAQSALFDVYHKTLQKIYSATDYEVDIRYFEFEVLGAHGHAPEMSYEYVNGGQIEPASLYTHIPEYGWKLATEQDQSNTRVHGSTIIALKNKCLDDAQLLRQSKRLLRFLLRYYLRFEVNSWWLLQELYGKKGLGASIKDAR